MPSTPEEVRRWAAGRKDKRKSRGDEDEIWKQTLLEASNVGATLSHDRPGGVDAGKALHIFRRDSWACQVCGTDQELELDHLDGHPEVTPTEQDLKHEDSARNIQTICKPCHDVLSNLGSDGDDGGDQEDFEGG